MSKKSSLKIGKAIDVLFQDYLKKAIKALLAFIAKVFWNIYGVSIILALPVVLIGLANWLGIPITMPAYMVGVTVIAIIVGTLSVQTISRKIKERQSRIMYEGLLWEYDKDINISGPLCPNCRKTMMVSDSSLDGQLENAASAIFGQKPVYTYQCFCGSVVTRNKSPSELVRSISYLLQDEIDGNGEAGGYR